MLSLKVKILTSNNFYLYLLITIYNFYFCSLDIRILEFFQILENYLFVLECHLAYNSELNQRGM